MKTTKRVNDQTISVHYFISQPVDDSVNYYINYNNMESKNRNYSYAKNVLLNQQLDKSKWSTVSKVVN